VGSCRPVVSSTAFREQRAILHPVTLETNYTVPAYVPLLRNARETTARTLGDTH